MYKLTLLLLFVTALSCKHEPLVNDGPVALPSGSTDVSFQDEVLPLMVSNCAMSGCHNAASRAEGIQLTDYTNIRKEVKPGNPGDSELYEVITENDPDKRMPPPPQPAFSSAQSDLIRRWIQEGARNTFRPEGNCDTAAVSYANTIRPILDQQCVGCHNNSLAEGGLNLLQFSQIQQKQNSIYQRISLASNDPLYMPKGGNLSACKTNQIKAWIHQGAQQN
jgi:hypothetical protein